MLQLFLEEEREREMEMLYETGIAETLNREDAAIGSGAPGVDGGPAVAAAEATGVNKQTTETLMAGEKIIEALDLADGELVTFREYEEAKAKGGLSEQIAPPPRNQILAAYDLSPEEYVLQVVQRIPSTALYDALLVLPFNKVVSLMSYLNYWAERVSVVALSRAV
jgi:U3 small nucleolar RNA-associated protein 12